MKALKLLFVVVVFWGVPAMIAVFVWTDRPLDVFDKLVITFGMLGGAMMSTERRYPWLRSN